MPLVRIACGLLGLMALVYAIFGSGFNRWGLYEFEDDSDIRLSRPVGRALGAIVGVALILGAIFLNDSWWL